MKPPEVPGGVWEGLYSASLRFKELECWKWMTDSDLFGVKNPQTEEVGYCCVLGMIGEVFGLVVYLGAEGLASYEKIKNDEVKAGDREFAVSQNCLAAYFSDRSDLQKTDLDVIKRLGLKLRGRNSWPQFRSYRSGYLPWYLTESEARYLTLALEQAREIALSLGANPDLLTFGRREETLVMVPAGEGEGRKWEKRWLKPPGPAVTAASPQRVDELRLQRIRNRVTRRDGTWEVDLLFAPVVVGGEERPYYPIMILCMDQDSLLILGGDLVEPRQAEASLVEKILQWIDAHEWLPEELWVAKKEIFDLLAPIALRLGVKPRFVNRLKAIECAREGLLDLFSHGPGQ